MIIVDASVMANALVGDDRHGKQARAELARDPHWAGPEHMVAETFSTIRGLSLAGKIDGQRAHDAVTTLTNLTIELLSTQQLLGRMWQLRDNVSGYDAAYAVAAETHGCPLVTADARLARAVNTICYVRLSAAAG